MREQPLLCKYAPCFSDGVWSRLYREADQEQEEGVEEEVLDMTGFDDAGGDDDYQQDLGGGDDDDDFEFQAQPFDDT